MFKSSVEITGRALVTFLSLMIFPWQVCLVCGIITIVLETAGVSLNLAPEEDVSKNYLLRIPVSIFGGPILLAILLWYWREYIIYQQ